MMDKFKSMVDQFKDKDLLNAAFSIAIEAHRLQWRKESMLPYIVHPCRVASQVARIKNPILTSVAFLHDVLEDCERDELEDYRERISNLDDPEFKIITMVEELTYTGTTSTEKENYIKSFDKKSAGAFIVKLFDRLDNIKDFHDSGNKEYAIKYAKKAIPLIDIWHGDTMFDLVRTEYGKAAQEITFGGIMELKGKLGL